MMKGILLAGGLGTRLYPLTQIASKHLLPVYDKPMIYYPLSVLMLAGIRDILVISSPEDLPQYKTLLKDGSHLGLNIEYAEQSTPRGIPDAFMIGESFIGKSSVCLILGDNIFYGDSLPAIVKNHTQIEKGAAVLAYFVKDPSRYGVVDFKDDKPMKLKEKPKESTSNWAVTGIYFYDNQVVEMAKSLKPSERGELEITDLNQMYLDKDQLFVEKMGRGMAWLDTGTHQSLLDASNFVEVIESRQGQKIACLEEIAYRMGYIDAKQLKLLAELSSKSQYGEYLQTWIQREGL